MNFLLMEKNKKPRFHNGNPFNYIKNRRCSPVKDYFEITGNYNELSNDFIYNFIFNYNEYNYYMVIFNNNGNNCNNESASNINSIATAFLGAYRFKYDYGDKIYSDAIIIKKSSGNDILEITNEEKKKLKKMWEDANEWFCWYLGNIK